MGGRRRRGLADLIGEVGTAPQEHEDEGRGRESTATEAAPERREEARESQPGSGGEATVREQSRDEAATPGVPPRVPKYLALERKEARLRGDQVDSLASLARRVNRQKPSRGGERITENTLIRVAVDWLLSQEDYVGGSTEEEIRRGLGVRHDAP
ncbi:MAG: hypothetical protein K0S10_1995 [Rubrobacteraceae bacterium]|jgi:hypothetical protein|nr:hypothetical protein [Rubrobacteraceae bacterium]